MRIDFIFYKVWDLSWYFEFLISNLVMLLGKFFLYDMDKVVVVDYMGGYVFIVIFFLWENVFYGLR